MARERFEHGGALKRGDALAQRQIARRGDGVRDGRRGPELEDWDAQHWSNGPVDPALSPEEDLLARDGERRIAAALLALPVKFREAVVLRDLEGLSYEEIAAVLQVRTGTVRSRIARGRERLRPLLEDHR